MVHVSVGFATYRRGGPKALEAVISECLIVTYEYHNLSTLPVIHSAISQIHPVTNH
jgi:hypothetical protein